MKRYLLLIVLLIAFSVSCKKNDDKTETTTQKVQHRWGLQNYTVNNHFGGTDDIEIYTGTSADYIDFRTDGKVYSMFANEGDTASYSIQGDDNIIIGGLGTYTIKTLTSSQLVLNFKETENNGDFYEETINLQR